jgi:hypothetical protein
MEQQEFPLLDILSGLLLVLGAGCAMPTSITCSRPHCFLHLFCHLPLQGATPLSQCALADKVCGPIRGDNGGVFGSYYELYHGVGIVGGVWRWRWRWR